MTDGRFFVHKALDELIDAVDVTAVDTEVILARVAFALLKPWFKKQFMTDGDFSVVYTTLAEQIGDAVGFSADIVMENKFCRQETKQ